MTGWRPVKLQRIPGPLSPHMGEKVNKLMDAGLLSDTEELETLGYFILAQY